MTSSIRFLDFGLLTHQFRLDMSFVKIDILSTIEQSQKNLQHYSNLYICKVILVVWLHFKDFFQVNYIEYFHCR